MRISIIGAGNGGQAMAGHFSILGHKITLYDKNSDRIDVIKQKGGIILTESIKGYGEVYSFANNPKDAVLDSELIIITTTADAHKNVAQSIAPFLTEGQIIILSPGRTLGALEFSKTIKQITEKRVYVAEAQSLIYACRAENHGEVRIIGVKDKVLFSAYPSVDTDYVINIVNNVFNCFVKSKNSLVTGLENIGAILHPTVVLFNAAAIEREQMFYFYNDMTPAIANIIEEIDKERLSIGRAFGIKLKSVSEWISFAYKNIEGTTLLEKMRNNPAYYKILAPNTLQSRLLLEDIPTGILPMTELAKISNLKVPLMESILKLSQTMLNIDFTINGRTLKNLGIENLNLDQLQELL